MSSNDLPTIIKNLMSKKDVNSQYLARKSDVKYSTLQRFLSSEGDISSARLIRILKTLDFDLVDALKEDGKSRKNFKSVPSYLLDSFFNVIEGRK